MELLAKEPTTSTPLVSFTPSTNTLYISGESFPQNAFEFYAPVISWLRTTLAEIPEFTLDIAVTYMNSSSTKCVFDMLDIMGDAVSHDVKAAVIWRYDRENPRSAELAEDFREEVNFPFEVVALN